MGFASLAGIELLERIATQFSNSTMVPTAYQAVVTSGYKEKATTAPNPAGVANCMIALDMAQRLGASPLQVMQNLHVIEGRPSWSSQFIIAAINSSGKFSPLRFDIKWDEHETEAEYTTLQWSNATRQKEPVTSTVRLRNATCVAWTTERGSGQRLESSPVSLVMAVSQGWYTKNGSKWPSMPELMLQYRSAAFFGRIYAPEILMGLQTQEEVQDVFVQNEDGTVTQMTGQRVPPSTGTIDPGTGAVKEEKSPSKPPASAPAAEAYPQDRFEHNLKKWVNTAVSEGKPVEYVIDWVEGQGRGSLTAEQVNTLRAEIAAASQAQVTDVEPKSETAAATSQDSAPVLNADKVIADMQAAKDTEALYEVANLMEAFEGTEDYARLNAVFEEMQQKLGG